MRLHIKQITEKLAKLSLFKGTIYEFGSYRVPGQEELADLRPLFPQQNFVGCDIRPGLGVDRIEDITKIKLPDNSVDSIICLDTLEHVEDCFKAFEEMYRILSPTGVLFVVSTMLFPIHEYPIDYWRFTPFAFESLGKCFMTKIIFGIGQRKFPSTVGGIFSKEKISKSDINNIVDVIQQQYLVSVWGESLTVHNEVYQGFIHLVQVGTEVIISCCKY